MFDFDVVVPVKDNRDQRIPRLGPQRGSGKASPKPSLAISTRIIYSVFRMLARAETIDMVETAKLMGQKWLE